MTITLTVTVINEVNAVTEILSTTQLLALQHENSVTVRVCVHACSRVCVCVRACVCVCGTHYCVRFSSTQEKDTCLWCTNPALKGLIQ